MPTVLRTGPYQLYFYSQEGDEPPHVHVDRDSQTAKYWLAPVRLARNFGFSAKEAGGIGKMLVNHEWELLEAWNDHFGH